MILSSRIVTLLAIPSRTIQLTMASLPKTMKAAQITSYGDDFDEILSVQNNVPVPQLDDPYEPVEKIHPIIQAGTRKDRKTHMIIKTLAVALSPIDCNGI